MLTEIARAKLNLALHVRARRPDGYHDLESLVAFADVCDGIDYLPGAPDVTVTGRFAGGIAGTNIAALALQKVAEAAPGIELGAGLQHRDAPGGLALQDGPVQRRWATVTRRPSPRRRP